MRISTTFTERVQTTTDVNRLQQEVDTIRRIVITEHSPALRDELCDKQRYIERRLYDLETHWYPH